jgi:hypothetical protein
MIVYVSEIVQKNGLILAVYLILFIGSFGFFLNLLASLILNDFQELCILSLMVQSISIIMYFQYIDSPFFVYANQQLGILYSNMKKLLRYNFGSLKSHDRLNALKGLLFNTDDSSFWISNLIEGRLPMKKRPEDLPKPKLHFLDDSRIEMSEISSKENTRKNIKSFSEKAPEETKYELNLLEEKLFNEDECSIDRDTFHLLYDVTKPKEPLFFMKSDQIKHYLGCFSLLVFHMFGFFMSYCFLLNLNIYSSFWCNFFFSLSIFFGIFLACFFIPQIPSRSAIILILIFIGIICINFSTLEYAQDNYEHDNNFISVPGIMFLHTMILVSILSSSTGYLLLYIVQLFNVRSRVIALGTLISLSMSMMALVMILNFKKIFQEGWTLNCIFIFTVVNILIGVFMPSDRAIGKKKGFN